METTIAFVIVTLVAISTATLAYIFDWNETHVYNPRWPPHAKFHNAQTLQLGSLLGICALILLWRERNLHWAIFASSLYWISQLGSLAFPGTALVDPEFRNRPGANIPKQPILASVLLLLLISAWFLGAGAN
jgi:hypothetical protein